MNDQKSNVFFNTDNPSKILELANTLFQSLERHFSQPISKCEGDAWESLCAVAQRTIRNRYNLTDNDLRKITYVILSTVHGIADAQVKKKDPDFDLISKILTTDPPRVYEYRSILKSLFTELTSHPDFSFIRLSRASTCIAAPWMVYCWDFLIPLPLEYHPSLHHRIMDEFFSIFGREIKTILPNPHHRIQLGLDECNRPQLTAQDIQPMFTQDYRRSSSTSEGVKRKAINDIFPLEDKYQDSDWPGKQIRNCREGIKKQGILTDSYTQSQSLNYKFASPEEVQKVLDCLGIIHRDIQECIDVSRLDFKDKLLHLLSQSFKCSSFPTQEELTKTALIIPLTHCLYALSQLDGQTPTDYSLVLQIIQANDKDLDSLRETLKTLINELHSRKFFQQMTLTRDEVFVEAPWVPYLWTILIPRALSFNANALKKRTDAFLSILRKELFTIIPDFQERLRLGLDDETEDPRNVLQPWEVELVLSARYLRDKGIKGFTLYRVLQTVFELQGYSLGRSPRKKVENLEKRVAKVRLRLEDSALHEALRHELNRVRKVYESPDRKTKS